MFAVVRCRSLQFDIRQFNEPRRLANSGAFQRTAAQSKSLGERRNFQLAKVGVAGANPIARSKLSQMAKVTKDGGF